MFSEINVTVEDGNLGKNASFGTGVQVKIGVCSVESSVPLLVTNTMKTKDIREKLGYTPLADACMDALENGLKTIYAIPVKASVDGEVGTVKKTGTSPGTITVEGKPNNSYDVVVKIIEEGSINEGSFSCSIDGGNSFSEECTIPLTGSYGIEGTGLTLKFTDAGEGETSFFAGDAWSVTTVSPAMSNESVLKAVESLVSFNAQFELVHIVGVSTKTLWAALQQEAVDFMETYKRPVLFLCEARPVRENETLDEYMAAMGQERKGISSRFLCVSLSYGTYVRKDLRTQNINLAGIVTGLLGRAKESLSIGYVKDFAISSAKLLALVPEGISEYSRAFDEMGYTVFRQYAGLEDFYVSNANVMSPEDSDFHYVENVRVLNRIIRDVSRKATENLQSEIDPEDLEGSIKPIQEELNIALEDAMADKIISTGEVTIDTENLNILADETLDVRVEWVPMGTARVFNLTFAVSNPAASGGE